MSKSKNVIKISDAEAEKQKAREVEAQLLCEAMAKDDPSPEAKAYIQERLEKLPDDWRHHGDLMAEATDLAFKNFWLKYMTKASVQHGAELLKRDLGYEDAPPLIKLLIEQAVMCHIRLGMIEHTYSRVMATQHTLTQGAHYEMRLTLAQRRYAKAITTLAKVKGCLHARSWRKRTHAAPKGKERSRA